MRLPNGFGNISKLTGKRRNPWRARKTTGWTIDEETKKAKQQYVTIGYYPTRQQALQALSEYNASPYDLNANKITFAEIYERWSEKKFTEISPSNVNGYKAAYKMCEAIYDMRLPTSLLALNVLTLLMSFPARSLEIVTPTIIGEFPTKTSPKTLTVFSSEYSLIATGLAMISGIAVSNLTER